MHRTLILSLLLFFSVCAEARAQTEAPSSDPGAVLVGVGLAAGLTLALDTTLVIAMLDAAAHEHWVTVPWAVTEIGAGALHLGLGIAQMAMASRDAQPFDGGGLAFGLVLTVIGALFSGHGIASLVLGQSSGVEVRL